MTEQCVVVLLQDLSAAFDTVDQKILLYKTAIQVWYKRKSACVTSVLSQYGSFPVSSD